MNQSHQPATQIVACPDGPLLIRGTVEIVDPDGERLSTHRTIALCRCGVSAIKPFCDGTHKLVGFHTRRPDAPPPLDSAHGRDYE